MRIMLIDGNSIANRAFYALPPLTNKKGVYTNAIVGFMNILMRFLEGDKPDHLVIAFDLKAPTFRHEEFKDYKAQRKGMPEELRSQMPLIKELVTKMNIPILELAGYEADDIIGTIAKRYEALKYDVVIVSGDKDLLQVATDKINVKIPKTKKGATEVESYFQKDVVEALGVTPLEYIDVKALMGDASDNIPGVPGVGEKTAFKLISEYKSLEGLYQNIDQVSGNKIKQSLIENEELAQKCRFLATIKLDVPIELDEEKSRLQSFYNEEVLKLLTELEMRSLIEKLKRNFGEDVELKDLKLYVDTKTEQSGISEVIEVEKIEEFKKLLLQIQDTFYFKLFLGEEIESLAFVSEGKIYFLKIASMLNDSEIAIDPFMDALKEIFENEKITKVSYNIKEDIKPFLAKEIDIVSYFDLVLAYYIAYYDSKEYDIQSIAGVILGREIDIKSMFLPANKKNRNEMHLNDLDKEKQRLFLVNAMSTLLDSYEPIKQKLEVNNQQMLFYEIENPLIKVLAKMEQNGVRIDVEELKRYASTLSARLKELEKEIHAYAGYAFNINSPSQLASVLFDKLMLKAGKKTKTGYSTNIEVLEKLVGEHPIIELLIEYRQLQKIKSTYADGMMEYVSSDYKIHTTYNQMIASTGRLTSTDPNLQNIPIRVELGRKIRKAFIPESEEYVFIDADYSQIELRILAHLAFDQMLIKAYNENEDIHRLTASQILNKPYAEVTNAERGEAKAVNFGIIYGISAYGLGKDINISRKKAEEYIDSYFAKYKTVKEYLEALIDFANENGYSKTLYGRRRSVDELKSSNFMQREFGKRVAMNSPIQGTAADIMKIAMIKLENRLKNDKINAKILLQVHDELLIQAKREELDKIKQIVKYELENAVKLSVPLTVNLSSGENWYETK